MTTRELRIGNIVQGMQVTVVKSLSEREINGWNCGSFSGIPLTEEVLLKCGFEKYDTYSNNGIELNFENNEYFLYDSGETRNISDNPVKYLHQLQNLYFALTGKELEVKL